MNVHDAKVPFEEQTLDHQCHWLAHKMGCSGGFFDKAKKDLEYADQMLIAKIDLLRSMVEQPKFQQFIHEFAEIEFAANVHIIFISRFLNRNARLVLTTEERKCDAKGNTVMSLNLYNEIEIMSKCLAYFDTWKAWCMDQKTEDMYTKWRVKKWDQLFISNITFRNLKICIGGFFAYARQVLSNPVCMQLIQYCQMNI